MTDADRRNLYARIAIRNPLASTIEWEKHESPKLWARLHVGSFEAPTALTRCARPVRRCWATGSAPTC